mgnify:CR=1 FL=1
MNKYDNLMTKIGTEFNIKKGKTESVNDYKVRLIYSVLGRMAVSSFLDDYDNDMPSIVHMKIVFLLFWIAIIKCIQN